MIFDHLGIFVPNLARGRAELHALIGVEGWGEAIDDPGLRVRVQFGRDASGVRYELVAPNGAGNPVEPVLAAGRGILNHVAYRVDDLDAALSRLRATGAMPLGPAAPAVAFGGRRVAFMLGRAGFIVELIDGLQP